MSTYEKVSTHRTLYWIDFTMGSEHGCSFCRSMFAAFQPRKWKERANEQSKKEWNGMWTAHFILGLLHGVVCAIAQIRCSFCSSRKRIALWKQVTREWEPECDVWHEWGRQPALLLIKNNRYSQLSRTLILPGFYGMVAMFSPVARCMLISFYLLYLFPLRSAVVLLFCLCVPILVLLCVQNIRSFWFRSIRQISISCCIPYVLYGSWSQMCNTFS